MHGAIAGDSALTFDFFTEQGSISLGQMEFVVRKHGPLSGYWTLERKGLIAAEARKPHAMFRRFEVSAADSQIIVKAQTAFTRSYEILSGGQVIGAIEPAHALTRRAFIECNPQVSEPIQLFSFWLAALTWRRAARNRNAR